MSAQTKDQQWNYSVAPPFEGDDGLIWIQPEPMPGVKLSKDAQNTLRFRNAVILATQKNGQLVPVKNRAYYLKRSTIIGRLYYGNLAGEDGFRQLFVECAEDNSKVSVQ